MSKMARYDFRIAVHALMTRQSRKRTEVLLGLRQNTSYGDGFWSFPAGHQETYETSAEALVRELKEEVGVVPAAFNALAAQPVLQIEHLKDYGPEYPESPRRFRHYMELYYRVPQWAGEIRNMEPDKCGEVKFFPLTELPDNTLPLTRFALNMLQAGQQVQARFGWHNPDYPAWRKVHPGV